VILQAYLDLAIQAALETGKLQLEMLQKPLQVESKSHAADLVTEADKACEVLVRQMILSKYPDHAILGEEGGQEGSNAHRWIVDPIDGTVNYAHGYPHFCVSIGLEIEGKLSVGVVYEPSKNELFTATAGGGAYLNQRRISVSDHSLLGGRTIAGNYVSSGSETFAEDKVVFMRVSEAGVPIRVGGSGALDLCYIACGRMDAHWQRREMPWDCAAGNLLIREAGGKVTHLNGKEHDLANAGTDLSIIASNGKIHKELLNLILIS
jgi:myo-inositol-1(or 4)-monophosphatase